MTLPSDAAYAADLPHRLWFLQRLARGLAHDLANVQQMLLVPDLPDAVRAEADVRLGHVADTLSAWGHDDPAADATAPISLETALASSATLHGSLGGEPRTRCRIEGDDDATFVIRARPLDIDRALTSVLVVAARSHDRRSGLEIVLRVSIAADHATIDVVVSPAPGVPSSDEDAWLLSESSRLLTPMGGAIVPSEAGHRGTWRVRLPRLTTAGAPRP